MRGANCAKIEVEIFHITFFFFFEDGTVIQRTAEAMLFLRLSLKMNFFLL